MKKHYSDYVTHCLRFYSRHPKPNYFKSEADRKDWQAVDVALKAFSDTDRETLLTIYREGDTIAYNVYQLAKKRGIKQDGIWNLIDKLEKKVAKRRDLV